MKRKKESCDSEYTNTRTTWTVWFSALGGFYSVKLLEEKKMLNYEKCPSIFSFVSENNLIISKKVYNITLKLS